MSEGGSHRARTDGRSTGTRAGDGTGAPDAGPAAAGTATPTDGAPAGGARADLRRGLGSEDNPLFRDMHRASRHVVGASLEAARRVWSGEVQHAANIAGGLHHAMPERVSGFCVYNDVAVAIRWLLDQGIGLAVFGTNSEANSLAVDERIALLDRLIGRGFPS